jgi:DNA-directed RNA polymerase specialized sigma24 family protein
VAARFSTTSWSLILRAASLDDAEARLALSLLCEAYWYPVYAYVRRQGASAPDAEDLTQAYFARFLEKGVVREVQPGQGRFRSFLLVSVRNFVHNERDRANAVKRGGGHRLVSLDAQAAEERWRAEPVDPTTPESAFERSWAASVIGHATERMERALIRRGAGPRLARLRPYLLDEEPDPPYREIASEWGTTVSEPAEVEDEIRFLRRALAR